MRRFLVVLLVLALLAVSLTYLELVKPASPPAEQSLTGSRHGDTCHGDMLAEHGIIRSRYAFDFWHLVRGGTLKAGEYQFVESATLPAVYNRIVRGMFIPTQ